MTDQCLIVDHDSGDIRPASQAEYWSLLDDIDNIPTQPHIPTTVPVREIVDQAFVYLCGVETVTDMDQVGYTDADRVGALASLTRDLSSALDHDACTCDEDCAYRSCPQHGEKAMLDMIGHITYHAGISTDAGAEITNAIRSVEWGTEA